MQEKNIEQTIMELAQKGGVRKANSVDDIISQAQAIFMKDGDDSSSNKDLNKENSMNQAEVVDNKLHDFTEIFSDIGKFSKQFNSLQKTSELSKIQMRNIFASVSDGNYKAKPDEILENYGEKLAKLGKKVEEITIEEYKEIFNGLELNVKSEVQNNPALLLELYSGLATSLQTTEDLMATCDKAEKEIKQLQDEFNTEVSEILPMLDTIELAENLINKREENKNRYSEKAKLHNQIIKENEGLQEQYKALRDKIVAMKPEEPDYEATAKEYKEVGDKFNAVKTQLCALKNEMGALSGEITTSFSLEKGIRAASNPTFVTTRLVNLGKKHGTEKIDIANVLKAVRKYDEVREKAIRTLKNDKVNVYMNPVNLDMVLATSYPEHVDAVKVFMYIVWREVGKSLISSKQGTFVNIAMATFLNYFNLNVNKFVNPDFINEYKESITYKNIEKILVVIDGLIKDSSLKVTKFKQVDDFVTRFEVAKTNRSKGLKLMQVIEDTVDNVDYEDRDSDLVKSELEKDIKKAEEASQE